MSLLAVLSGFIASKNLLENKHSFLTQSYQHLSPLSVTIGVVALAVAVASFLYSILSLNILASIVPQSLVFITGLLLAKELVMKKLQERSDGDVAKLAAAQEANLNKLSIYQAILGLATLSAGMFYLVSAGTLYVI